jgi:phospholipid transport system substrate-binding protein
VIDLAAEGALGFEELRSVYAAGEAPGVYGLAEDLRARATRLLEPPEHVVARLQDALIEAMKRADELGYEGRRELLAPVVADTHDFESIVKLVLGRAWRELSDEERAQLVAAFGELALSSYAARFDAYDGQRFGAPESKPVRAGAAQVTSAFHKAGGGEVEFEYLMRHGEGLWRILNIVVDGVSDLALKKTEYGALIEEGGAAAVLAKLDEQIARHAAGEKD